MASVKLDVYYDGACPFCIESMQRLIHIDKADRLNFVDLNLPAAAKVTAGRFSAADLADEMHVRLPDGTWRIGYYAWAAIVAVLPGISWLSAVMLMPPSAEVGRIAYRAFASRRQMISKLLGMPSPCDSNAVCKVPTAPRTSEAS